MTIKPGDSIPSATLYMMAADGPTSASTEDLFKGKKVALFGLPGAFTPTCSAQHVPGYLENAAALKEKGIDSIICLSVNDAFVMGAWGKDQGVGDEIIMAADGSALFSKAMGLDMDLTERGMGVRCQRFSMIVDDGVVSVLNHEPPGEFRISSAETMLEQL
ncbi:MAG: peroxiredoxin [Rhodospirillaceae bacterium]|nr:peroxiredoxin [Rhodospirillaceae bacterium]MBL6932785.1 peroxiredoxin [Rhodospirillales bacterium]